MLLVGSGQALYAACAPTDMWCYQTGSYASPTQQGKLDASGNLTINGNLTQSGSGTSTNTGNSSITGNSTVSGKTIFPSAYTASITSMTTITPASTYILACSTGGPVTVGGTVASIATTTATNGQWIVIGSTCPTASVAFTSSTVSGMGLGAATRTVDWSKRLTLIYDSVRGLWLETGFGNN